MKTNPIGNTANLYAPLSQNAAKGQKGNANQVSNPISSPVDTFTPSSQNSLVASGVANPQAINDLIKETDHHANAIRKLVRAMIGGADSTGQGFWAQKAQNMQLNAADRAQAQQMVSDEGFFGVSQTTERIMGFAKALVGEGASEEQIENMRAAVQAGFDQVARMFGGFDNLPEVTRNTHAAIMESFDNWIAGGRSAGAEE